MLLANNFFRIIEAYVTTDYFAKRQITSDRFSSIPKADPHLTPILATLFLPHLFSAWKCLSQVKFPSATSILLHHP